MRLRVLMSSLAVICGVLVAPTAANAATGDDPVVVVVGDIACDPESANFNHGEGTRAGCRQQAVGDVVAAADPDAFLAAGDIQYKDGRMAALKASYDKAFGAVKDRTFPVPGDVQASGSTKTCTTTGTSCRVTGLSNGKTHRFRVVASNSTGYTNGDYGTPVTVGKVPGKPANIAVAPRPSSAHVTWDEPVESGGLPVTGYTVTASPGGATCTTTKRSCLVPGLTVGTKYTFAVKATNDAGTCPSGSGPAAVVIPAKAAPGAPSIVAMRRSGDGAATLTMAQSELPGSVTSTIKATASPSGRTCTVTLPATECQITGLTNGNTYTFTAKATGPDGTSGASALTDPLLVGRRPGRPLNATAVALAGGDARVTWDAPPYDGGLPVTGYQVSGTAGSGCTAEGRSCLITGLTPGSKYTWAVRAVNDAGMSETSPGTAPVTALAASRPDAPAIATSERAGDGKVRVVVQANRANGAPITSFTVRANPGIKTCVITTPATDCTMTGLTNGTF